MEKNYFAMTVQINPTGGTDGAPNAVTKTYGNGRSTLAEMQANVFADMNTACKSANIKQAFGIIVDEKGNFAVQPYTVVK